MRMWWLHFGQTLRLRSSSARYSTASQAEHLIHRPSGTERVRRSVLIRDGMIFSNQDISGRFLVDAVGESAADDSGLERIASIGTPAYNGQSELAGVSHRREVQAVGRRRRGIDPAIASCQHRGNTTGGRIPTTHADEKPGDVAHHV